MVIFYKKKKTNTSFLSKGFQSKALLARSNSHVQIHYKSELKLKTRWILRIQDFSVGLGMNIEV
jgi:hypothetical protein